MVEYNPNVRLAGISLKDTDGTQQSVIKMVTDSDDIMLKRGSQTYSLTKFFENYMTFLDENKYVAYGPNQPKNGNSFPIWIDTSGK